MVPDTPIACLDTSVFIESWHTYYPPDLPFFQPIWETLQRGLIEGWLVSSHAVWEELKRKDDDITTWVKPYRHAFLPLSEEIQYVHIEIINSHPKLVNTIKGRSYADPWVIATAKHIGCAVVTFEKPGSTKRPKIPDVCAAYHIPIWNLPDLLRNLP